VVDDALRLAGLGFRVFPLHRMLVRGSPPVITCSCGRSCSSPGKHPRTPSGCLDASKDPVVIREWFSTVQANIGLATGAGVYVVDLDGEEGETSWMALGLDEPAMRARTGSGGRHLYYGVPLDDPLPNTHWKIGDGIDTRGAGGYVVAPPSNHASGDTYRWSTDSRILTPLPDELRTLLAPRVSTPSATPRLSDATSPYGTGVLTNACRRIQAAAEGNRNNTLNEEAFVVGQWVGGGEIGPCGVAQLLAESCTGPDQKKNARTVARALHAGMTHPRFKNEEPS
jgi:hypothetical protein